MTASSELTTDLLATVRRHAVGAPLAVQILDADALVSRPFDPGIALVVVPAAAVDPAPALPGRAHHASSPAALLRALYPQDHPVVMLDDETAPQRTVGELDDEAVRRGGLSLPALEPEVNRASPYGLPWLVARLRAPDGCPWDREQDHLSLRKFLLEESYEVYDALEEGSTPRLADELGDLLLQIVLHSQYAAEAGVFDLSDVHRGVMTKIIRRHPHVFGDVEARSVDQVVRNWERIKADERATAGGAEPMPSESEPGMPAAFAGLSRSLPALAYAQEIQERAASLGYDWPEIRGVVEKIAEEAQELSSATDPAARREELGDLLLVVVNLARRMGIDAEASLRAASAKFAARFARVERLARDRGVSLRDLDPAALDELWQQAKSAA